MRVLALAIFLALAVSVAAEEDDDKLLETAPLGEGIPERSKALEREWAEDVGAPQAPGDETEAAPPEHDGDEPADEEHERKDEPAAPPAPSPKSKGPVRGRRDEHAPERPSTRSPQPPTAPTKPVREPPPTDEAE
jgi:hypothetical protein